MEKYSVEWFTAKEVNDSLKGWSVIDAIERLIEHEGKVDTFDDIADKLTIRAATKAGIRIRPVLEYIDFLYCPALNCHSSCVMNRELIYKINHSDITCIKEITNLSTRENEHD